MKKVIVEAFDTGDHTSSIYYIERGRYAWAVLGGTPSGNGDWAEIGPDALITRLARDYRGPQVGQCSKWYLGGAEVTSVEDVTSAEAAEVYKALGRAAAAAAVSAADDAQRLRWAEKAL